MKHTIITVLITIVVFPLFVSGQEDYSDMTEAMKKLLSAQKTYITALEIARKSEDISLAMKEFGNNLKELGPVFNSLNARNPKMLLSRSKLPSDLLDTINTSESINKRLMQITLLSLYRYGSEPVVTASMEELKSTINALKYNDSK